MLKRFFKFGYTTSFISFQDLVFITFFFKNYLLFNVRCSFM